MVDKGTSRKTAVAPEATVWAGGWDRPSGGVGVKGVVNTEQRGVNTEQGVVDTEQGW